VLAHNLGKLWRRLVLPKGIDHWSLTSLQQRLVKTGERPFRVYIYLYIGSGFDDIVVPVSDETEKAKLATVVWEGDSREILKDFPEEVMQNLGFELWQLQQGERPRNYRALPSVGQGVFELRDQDERAWYRVVYLSRIEDVIYVLHCFEKKSREMPRKDFEKAKQRLKAVKARLAEGKRREKRS
jgi:phage-related protein